MSVYTESGRIIEGLVYSHLSIHRIIEATILTESCDVAEFWRSRRSLGFVFGKGKMRSVGVSLQVTEVLEAPARD